MRRPLVVLTLLGVVVLAGCAAPLVDGVATPRDESTDREPAASPDEEQRPVPSTPAPIRDVDQRTPYPDTPTPQPAAVEVSDDIPVDANRTYARVRQLLGTDTPGPRVDVYNGPTFGGVFSGLEQTRFERAFGIGPPQPSEDAGTLEVAGATVPSGDVYIVPRSGRAPEIERTLAHEFTHTVQFDQGVPRSVERAVPFDRQDTADGELVERSILEGAAVYTASEYVLRYQPNYPTEKAQVKQLYENSSTGTRLFWSAYRYGSEYVAARVESPGELEQVYDDPPETTEQLLHGTDDEPAEIPVYAEDGESPWFVTDRDSRGELFVRITLRGELRRERAGAGADGWGNDQVLTFEGPGGDSYAWVLRWDDEANATEFADAGRAFLDRSGTRYGDRWERDGFTYRIERVDDRTITLLVGEESFVTETELRDEPDRVVVEPPT